MMMTCGDGVLQAGEQCDQGGGNVANGDGCSATCQLEFGCEVTPASGCRLPTASKAAQIQIADKTPDSKDRLLWKYGKGAATTVGDFGTPLTTTEYFLCIYANNTLVEKTKIPPGGLCAGKACWSAKTTGFKYKDKDLTPDGIQQVVLKAGLAGKTKIQVKGTGVNLPTPTLPLSLPVKVQLKNSNGVCWEANYAAPALKNTTGLYKDKSN
jgi:cysteine-rich repeat protein